MDPQLPNKNYVGTMTTKKAFQNTLLAVVIFPVLICYGTMKILAKGWQGISEMFSKFSELGLDLFLGKLILLAIKAGFFIYAVELILKQEWALAFLISLIFVWGIRKSN